MTDNQTLLARYVQTGSDAAFRELVTCYVDLVYSTALRLVGGDTHRAEDVAQTVFINLARVARTLPKDVKLGGWLHRDTCFAASTLMRGERRRHFRERLAVEMNALQDNSGADYSLVAPVLDEAINELDEADRIAILLRFFEQQNFRSVGQALSSNEDAARMRVTRALEKLEGFLKRRGITTTATSLGVVLSANAVQAAPVGLALTISTAAALTGTTLATTATVTATQAIAMTALQKTLVAATIAVLAGAGIYEARQASQLREQIQIFQQQQAPLAEKLFAFQRERDDMTNRITALAEEVLRNKSNSVELLKLRGEVGTLRRQNQMFTSASASPETKPGQSLSKGFGSLGEYLPIDNISDAGNDTPEALLQTFVWAIREGQVNRLEEIGGMFGGQSKPGDVVGQISESPAAIFIKMMHSAFTNFAGFHLSSKPISDGQKYHVRLDADPIQGSQNNEFPKNLNMSFVLERKTDGWRFGNPSEITDSK